MRVDGLPRRPTYPPWLATERLGERGGKVDWPEWLVYTADAEESYKPVAICPGPHAEENAMLICNATLMLELLWQIAHGRADRLEAEAFVRKLIRHADVVPPPASPS